MNPKRIGLIGYDGVTALDLFGPLEVFDTAKRRSEKEKPVYETVVLSPSGEAFVTEQKIVVQPQCSLAEAPQLDTIIVPGGAGARNPGIVASIVPWLKQRANTTRRVASVCVGIYILAETGLLNGRRATTHWAFANDVSRRFPKIRIEPDAIFIREGSVYTSAGVTAGIDLSLALVEEDTGRSNALRVARFLVVYLKRSGGQMQFSEPLKFQFRSTDRFSELTDWMLNNMRSDLSVDVLAAHTCLGPRQFSRRFKAAFGTSPAAYVEELRLDQARERLSTTHQSVEAVAFSVGYASPDAFRRAFERRFGTPPNVYRKQFSAR